jgi:hypothetical protein
MNRSVIFYLNNQILEESFLHKQVNIQDMEKLGKLPQDYKDFIGKYKFKSNTEVVRIPIKSRNKSYDFLLFSPNTFIETNVKAIGEFRMTKFIFFGQIKSVGSLMIHLKDKKIYSNTGESKKDGPKWGNYGIYDPGTPMYSKFVANNFTDFINGKF